MLYSTLEMMCCYNLRWGPFCNSVTPLWPSVKLISLLPLLMSFALRCADARSPSNISKARIVRDVFDWELTFGVNTIAVLPSEQEIRY